MQITSLKTPGAWPRLRTALIVAVALTIMVSLVRWGGTARTGGLFFTGVALLIGLILGLGTLIWWLYLSPLPPARAAADARRPAARQVVASLALVSIAFFAIGGFWDELWHRRYGGFGNDFLWPPHFLLYISLAMLACFAGGGVLLVLQESGSMRNRFRAEPLLGLLGLVAGYLVASLPSDELWHRIYGKDLTAWSLPHLILAGGVTLVALVAAGVQLSVVPLKPWQNVRRLRAGEISAIVLVAWATILLIQFGTTEWDGIRLLQTEQQDAFSTAFWQRPPWLYPVVVAVIALFCGNFALHALRRVGAATLLGLLVLTFRLGSLAVLGPEAAQQRLGYVAHLLILPPLIALDAWYAARKSRAATLQTLIGGNLVASIIFVAAGLPLIARLMLWPPVNATTIPPMIGMSLVAGLAAGWAGARFGGWLGTLDRQAEQVALTRGARWATVGGVALALGVALAIALTAQPPAA